MTPDEIHAFKTKLAELKNAEDTSNALVAYLDEALWRDPVDVINEVEALTSYLKTALHETHDEQ